MDQYTKIYLYRFSGDFIPIVPLLGVFFANSGLTLSTLSIIFFVLSITILILEIPSGILADRGNIKNILLFSRIAKLLAFIVIFLHPTLIGFIVGAIFWGISSAFDSGAFQSYLYTVIRDLEDQNHFEKIYGRAMTASMIGLLVGAGFSSQISYFGFQGLQSLGILSLVISLITLLSLPNVTKIKVSLPLAKTNSFAEAASFILKSPTLIILLIIGISAGGIKGSLDEYTSLLLAQKGLSLALIGYTIFTFEILKSLSGLFAGKVSINPKYQIIILLIFGLLFFSVGILSNPLLVIFCIALVITLDAMLWIHNDSTIQKLALDTNRSTLASIKNFGVELVAIFVFLLVWISGNNLTIHKLYLYLGLTLVGLSIITMIYKKLIHKKF